MTMEKHMKRTATIHARVIDTNKKTDLDSSDLEEIAREHNVSAEILAVAHGWPDPKDRWAVQFYRSTQPCRIIRVLNCVSSGINSINSRNLRKL